ncbi:hypothetical protein [Brevibacillus dissolubilis]|uniref:hypothetical protein n=1 Tax=Brevibacillus dissolubilis TaxID=1844116 RepID=UPI0011174F31|nr:hypothetical protein [Brevibacillus dissolubilis]
MSSNKGKATPKKKGPSPENAQPQMKIVSSSSCAVCKQPCARGMQYLERMKQPGAVGKGVPCILTLGKM